MLDRQKVCSVEGCSEKVRSVGLCARHYFRARYYGGNPTALRKNGRGPCLVEGCSQFSQVRGLCSKHYARWRKYGDPMIVQAPKTKKAGPKNPGLKSMPRLQRLMRQVQVQDGCWVWTGSRLPNGYGRISYQKRLQFVHRAMYEEMYGSIPEGLDICHTCDNPPCINPTHLWAGTPRENVLDSVRKGRWSRNRKGVQRIIRTTPEQIAEYRERRRAQSRKYYHKMASVRKAVGLSDREFWALPLVDRHVLLHQYASQAGG